MAEPAAEKFVVRNPVRERIAAGEVAFGMGVRVVRSGEIATLARATGHDFLYIDTQHAVFDPLQIAQIAQAALGVGIAPFVRVRSVSDPDIPVLLDAGVLGIVVPDVVSAEQARQLVEVTKYAPVGRRSLAGLTVHNQYLPVPIVEQTRAENDAVVLLCMVESAQGLSAMDEIAAVPGVDGIYVGLNDFLVDIGVPGAFDGPEAAYVLERLGQVAARHGIIAGSGGIPRTGNQVQAINAGVRFLMSSSDLGLIRTGGQQARDNILAGLAPEQPERAPVGAGRSR